MVTSILEGAIHLIANNFHFAKGMYFDMLCLKRSAMMASVDVRARRVQDFVRHAACG